MTVDLVPVEIIANKIFLIKGKKVMLDKDLAKLYGVKAIRLREQVKRNVKRFPDDFMFKLTEKQLDFVVSHFAIPSKKYFGGHLPYVFTEHGAVMLASILNSKRAVEMSIFVVRAFIKMREMIESYKSLLKIVKKLENQVVKHDEKIKVVFQVLKNMLDTPVRKTKKIGF